eukprot:TRINITY_DN28005_c0_g1_i1.p1 TRINITY_DN28005_c0_g1~~TRINITY_DN28005_c0_g1_i1.p1  ORF type:complete len:486 (+),score=173.03 TRINITY_DN28005_c0_g1_i1:83-1540(+)
MAQQLLCLLLVATTVGASAAPVESPIKHFVVMMLENRGFDHRIGWLAQYGFPIDGLSGNESNPIDPANPQNGVCRVTDTQDPYNTPNAGHSFLATKREQFGSDTVSPGAPPMNGFAWNENNCSVMESIPVNDIPVSRELLSNFAVIDRWFSSFPGPTEVNRMFLHSGQSHGFCDNPPDDVYAVGYPQESIFNRLERDGVSYRIYMQDDVATSLFFRDQRTPEAIKHYRPYDEFVKDCKEGKLPQYSVIEPRYFATPNNPANDEHPAHSIYQGELLLKSVYDNLRASPNWESTALLVTYDEHGGLYDHVPSPNGNGVPQPVNGVNCTYEGDSDYDFTRLGVRVPAFVVSPWVPKGFVQGEPQGPQPSSHYEHSSVLATVHQLFGTSGYMTNRDAWAGSLLPLFSKLSAPRTDCPERMPEPPAGTDRQMNKMRSEHDQPLNDLQQSLIVGMVGLLGERYNGTLQTEWQGAKFVAEVFREFRHRIGSV